MIRLRVGVELVWRSRATHKVPSEERVKGLVRIGMAHSMAEGDLRSSAARHTMI